MRPPDAATTSDHALPPRSPRMCRAPSRHPRSDKVFRAMSVCPRGHFVPRRHQNEAYVDMPIRVDQWGFNISAPHMHATALEALDIKPGDRCDPWLR